MNSTKNQQLSPSKEKINELNLVLSDDALSDKNEKNIHLKQVIL